MTTENVTSGTVTHSDTSRETAGIYCRLSLAAFGDTTKVDDQERICRELAATRGWDVPDDLVWKDNGKSAWRIGVRRPGWESMLAAADSGRLRNLIVYHGDRMVRQPYDLELLIRMVTGQGMTITSPTGTRQLDVAEDVFVLGILANVARLESENTSRRKKAGFARMRRNGLTRPGGPGGRCFGFGKDGVTHDPAEVSVVRRAAADVLAGHSLGAVARALASEGVVTTSGKPMTLSALRRILSYPRMAGLMPDGVSPAAWEPVLDRGGWEAIQAMLALNEASPRAGKGAQHLLSGIARCGAPGCGHVLWAGGGTAGSAYVCRKCRKIRRSIPLLDAYVGRRVVSRLNHPANPRPQLPDTPGLAAEYAALARQLTELDEILRDPRRGSLPALLERRDNLDRRLAELRSLASDDGRARLLSAHAGMTWEQWKTETLAVRRSLVAATFAVDVLPASRRGPGFRTEDVRLTPR